MFSSWCWSISSRKFILSSLSPLSYYHLLFISWQCVSFLHYSTVIVLSIITSNLIIFKDRGNHSVAFDAVEDASSEHPLPLPLTIFYSHWVVLPADYVLLLPILQMLLLVIWASCQKLSQDTFIQTRFIHALTMSTV